MGENQALMPQQRRTRRGGMSPTIVITMIAIVILSISIGIFVVVESTIRRRQPKELSINHHNNTVAPQGCEATILLMRHCEKFGPLTEGKHGSQHCSYLGMERAKFLAKLFSKKWPAPSFLYALHPDRGGHETFRQVETLTPLANKLALTINSDYQEEQRTALATDLFEKLRSGEMCGKVALVSWTHRSLPQLAVSLGCTGSEDQGGCPQAYPVTEFDQVWQLKYVYGPSVKKHKKNVELKWHVYPTVTQMGFDPLEFSYKEGDYYSGNATYEGLRDL